MKEALQGQVVCLTRAAQDGDDLAARLTALGAQVVHLPCVRLQPIEPPTQGMLQSLAYVPHAAWMVFASRHGVDFWLDFLAAQGVAVAPQTRLACVGPATAQALRRRLRAATVVASPSTAEGLAAELLAVARRQDGPVLLPNAEQGRRVVYDSLQAHGFVAVQVAVYRTQTAPLDDAPWVLPTPLHWVVFTSPSTVRGFVARAALPSGVRVLTIGPTTSAAAAEAGLPVSRQAATHDLDGLVHALVEAAKG